MPVYSLEILVALLAVGLLLIESFLPRFNKNALNLIAIAGLSAVLALLFFVQHPTAEAANQGIYRFYAVDGMAYFYKGLLLLATILVLFVARNYQRTLTKYIQPDSGLAEFYCLPVLTCAGLMWMVSARDLITLFVSLELVSICLYGLVAFMKRNVGSLEAGVKYLILSALSTGFLVYGITWTYGLTGSFDLSEITTRLAQLKGQDLPILFAFVLLMAAFGFKIGAVPFQFWIPDVYQGAPTPVTALLSIASKTAGFAALTRVLQPFLHSGGANYDSVVLILFTMAAATLIYGNLAAIAQTNFKRLLAYSSVAHAGFLLLALALDQPIGGVSPAQVVAYYLTAYLFMNMAAFLILAHLRDQGLGEEISALNGLGQRSPFLAFVLVIAMASMAGVPLTAGFIGKALIIFMAVKAQYIVLAAIAILMAAVGFYYYFKVIRALYWEKPPVAAAEASAPLALSLRPSFALGLVLVILTGAILVLGVYPLALSHLWDATFFPAAIVQP